MATLKRSQRRPANAVPAPNAFVGKTDAPSVQELAKALGPSHAFWDQLVDNPRRPECDGQEWGSPSRKAGWSLRRKSKNRIIVSLIPLRSSFQAALVLGGRAVKVAREAKLPKSAL